ASHLPGDLQLVAAGGGTTSAAPPLRGRGCYRAQGIFLSEPCAPRSSPCEYDVRRLKNSLFAGSCGKPKWVRRGGGGVRRGKELAARIEPLRRVLFELQHKISMHLYPIHPFDNQHGIRTSGF